MTAALADRHTWWRGTGDWFLDEWIAVHGTTTDDAGTALRDDLHVAIQQAGRYLCICATDTIDPHELRPGYVGHPDECPTCHRLIDRR